MILDTVTLILDTRLKKEIYYTLAKKNTVYAVAPRLHEEAQQKPVKSNFPAQLTIIIQFFLDSKYE